MGFPHIIAGRVTLPLDKIPSSVDPSRRLYEGLASQEVDALHHDGAEVYFSHRKGIHAPVPRPGGSSWIFEGVDGGRFAVTTSSTDVVIDYELSMRRGSRLILVLAVAISAAIYFYGKAEHEWAPMFGLFLLALWVFVYVRKARRLRRWLRLIMISEALPEPEPLMAPDVGG